MEMAKITEKFVLLLLVAVFMFKTYSAIAKLKEGKIGTSNTKELSEFRSENYPGVKFLENHSSYGFHYVLVNL